jgi:hypothetical protein
MPLIGIKAVYNSSLLYPENDDNVEENDLYSTVTTAPAPPNTAPAPPNTAPAPPNTAPAPPNTAPLQPDAAPSFSTKPRLERELPDDDCIFNPSLEKCAPVEGNCPTGFGMNEEEQCIAIECPSGFTHLDEDESGACYPNVIERINDKVKNILTTNQSQPTCNISQNQNMSLDVSTLEKDDAIILLVVKPCRITDGNAILDLPPDNQDNLKLIGLTLSENDIIKLVVLETKKIQNTDESPTLYKTDFREKMLGMSTHRGEMITIEGINALALWNNSTKPVAFTDNSVTLNMTLSS